MIKKPIYSEDDSQSYFPDIPTLKFLQIIPARACNARCNHCFLYGKNGTKDYDTDFYKKQLDISKLKNFITDIAETNNNFWVMLSGGEILLYDHVEELCRFLKQKRVPIVLLTNGLKISEYKSLLFDTVMSLSISIDGDAIVHDEMRNVKGMYKTVTDNIKDLISEKRRRGVCFPSVTLNYSLTPYNLHGFNDFIDSLHSTFPENEYNLKFLSHNIKKPEDIAISFEPYYYTDKRHMELYREQMKKTFGCEISNSIQGFVNDKFEVDVSDLQNFLSNHPDAGSFIDMEEYFRNCEGSLGYKHCLTPWNSIMVTNRGNAFFCPDLEDYPLGNIYNDTFSQIWNGEKAKKFRDHLKKEKLAFCNRCAGMFVKAHDLKR